MMVEQIKFSGSKSRSRTKRRVRRHLQPAGCSRYKDPTFHLRRAVEKQYGKKGEQRKKKEDGGGRRQLRGAIFHLVIY